MATINPYLNFNGNADEAFNFYKGIFGGEFSSFSRFSDAPSDIPLPASDRNRVMHVALPIGKSAVLMGSDVSSEMPVASHGNGMHICVNPSSEAEATRIFKGLSAGGTVTMPLEKTFWGAYFGTVQDKFGVNWMINFEMNAG